jgi:hypothetical protein
MRFLCFSNERQQTKRVSVKTKWGCGKQTARQLAPWRHTVCSNSWPSSKIDIIFEHMFGLCESALDPVKNLEVSLKRSTYKYD